VLVEDAIAPEGRRVGEPNVRTITKASSARSRSMTSPTLRVIDDSIDEGAIIRA